jgi:hypothetical protein
LAPAVSDELRAQDGVVSDGVAVVEAEDVVLPIAPAWPVSERIPTAWVVHDSASSMEPQGSGHDRASQPSDPPAEAIFAAHMLSSRGEESATAHASSSSSSRQSA